MFLSLKKNIKYNIYTMDFEKLRHIRHICPISKTKDLRQTEVFFIC